MMDNLIKQGWSVDKEDIWFFDKLGLRAFFAFKGNATCMFSAVNGEENYFCYRYKH